MKTLLLRRARLVDPASGVDGVRDVLVEDGRIARVSGRSSRREGTVIDLDGLVLAPGFIDMHVHLREPGYEWQETIASGAAAAAASGFTAVAAMPATDPVNDNRAVTETILAAAARHAPVRVYPVGALSRGMGGQQLADIGEMVTAGAVAVCDVDRPVTDGSLMRRALEYCQIFGIPVLARAEDVSLAGAGVVHEGEVSTLLGLTAAPAAAEDAMLARDLMLAEDTGGRLHVQLVSTARAVSLLRWAQRRGARVTAEASPHHLVLTDEALLGFDTDLKVRPPLRPESDRQALVKGLRDGVIGAIVSDHAPFDEDEKAVEFARAPYGTIGLETTVGIALTRLVGEQQLPLARIIETLSTGPARALGVPGGRIEPGEPADLTVLDLGREQTVDPATFRSLSRNCAFKGSTLRGQAVMTIVNGDVVHDGR